MSNDGDSWLAAIIVAAFVGGGLYYYDHKQPEKTPAEIGKFQIFQEDHQGQKFLVDTSTGDAWRWVYMPGNTKNDPPVWYWEKTVRVY